MNNQSVRGRTVQGAGNNGVCDESCEDCGIAPEDGTGNRYGSMQETNGKGMNNQSVRGRSVQRAGNNGVCDESCEDCGVSLESGTGNQFGRNK